MKQIFSLTLTHEQMKTAMAHYLNNNVVQEDHTVQSVITESTGMFTVYFEQEEPVE